MARLTLDEIAAEVQNHISEGTFDLDYLNSLLLPAIRMIILESNTIIPPTTTTPQKRKTLVNRLVPGYKLRPACNVPNKPLMR